MATRAAVRLSSERDGRRAGAAASAAALGELNAPANLALVFASAGYDQAAVLRGVRESLGPDCAVSGCSGEGVIAQGESREVEQAVSVMALRLEGTSAQALLVEGYGVDPEGCAAELARQVGDPAQVVGLLVFPDGLTGDCTRFLNALRNALPEVCVVGGTAADAMVFERTWQYQGERATFGAVAAVVLRGSGRLRVAVSHGCTPIGPHQTITLAEGNWVKQIDGRPAWDVFKEYLDGDPKDLNADGIVHLCIGVAADPASRTVKDPLIIHTPLALDAATGALMFPGGGLRQGQRIRMTRRDAERIRSTAVECARLVKPANAPRPPAFVLQFDCAGRGQVMFGACAADDIIKPLRDEIGNSVPWVGVHTYGEIAASVHGLHYHNYTVALCGFYDP